MRLNRPTLLLLFLIPLFFLVGACQIGALDAPDDEPSMDGALEDFESPEADGPRAVIRSTTTVSGESPDATATPGPTQTPLPDRATCAEIRGTEYRSGAEREFYLANCLPTPEPTPDVPVAAPPAVPGAEVEGERWILVDIANQTTSAMIGDEPIYTALVTTGTDGWDTPVGTWFIGYRVENETMTSESIGAEEYYVLEDVLYTQYFTNEGHALHLNYWRTDDYFGNTRSSHGCVGMRLADAEFFWNFATIGTRVTVQ